MRLQFAKGEPLVRVHLARFLEALQHVVHPVLAIPAPAAMHDGYERNVVQQIVHPVRRDVSDDVAAPPVVVHAEGEIEAVLRRVRVHVANDLVGVAAFGGGADDDGPVQGIRHPSFDLSTPGLDDFDGIAARRDLHGVECRLNSVFRDRVCECWLVPVRRRNR